MRRKFVLGAMKAYPLQNEALASAQAVSAWMEKTSRGGPTFDLIFIPPTIYLTSVGQAIQGSPIALGAQNMDIEESGPYTGHITWRMLQDVGCKYVMLGHSELRRPDPPYCGESLDLIRVKVERALIDSALKPVLFIGENKEERDSGRTKEIIREQLLTATKGLASMSQRVGDRLGIAYEPIWAISKYNPPSPPDPAEVNKLHLYIRELLSETLGTEVAEKTRILYGGSVGPGNAVSFLAQSDIDGVGVGSGSVKPKDFIAVLDAVHGFLAPRA
jgi:triosephosphate isomerase (TIM)